MASKGLLKFSKELDLISGISFFSCQISDCYADYIVEWYCKECTIHMDIKKKEIMFIDGCVDTKSDYAITELARRNGYTVEYGFTPKDKDES